MTGSKDQTNLVTKSSQTPSEDTKSSSPVGEGDDTVRVFVYGSLKSKQGNNVLLQQIGATCLGYDSITGDFAMMSFGGFPGVVRTDPPDAAAADPDRPLITIYGELYTMDNRGLDSLDCLEHHPDWYERRKFTTDVVGRRAWMYTLPNSNGYLDASQYTQVPDCIWRVEEAETEFWTSQGEASGNEAAEG